MACYHPLQGWQSRYKSATGGYKIVFDKRESYGIEMAVPCGQCIGCRLDRSRSWAIRCVHEAELHDQNSFITLTYNNLHLPENGTLIKSDFQKFMKRLRKNIHPRKIRYYHCGEYGEKMGRPHYHACLFGYDFEDKQIHSIRDGIKLYRSKMLEKIWGKGFCTVGEVTFESAAYVARYIMKKVNGEQAEEHYKRIDQNTGEIKEIIPEYTTMSRRPGIASEWYALFKNDVFPSDNLIHKGRRIRTPRYYDNIYRHENPDAYDQLKADRVATMKANAEDNTHDRLLVKEKVKKASINKLKRTLK